MKKKLAIFKNTDPPLCLTRQLKIMESENRPLIVELISTKNY